MTPDENRSERDERVAALLRQAAVSERAPQRLREQLSAPRVGARAPARAGTLRSGWTGAARQALAPRPAEHRPAAAVTIARRRRSLVSLLALPLAFAVLVIVSSLASNGPAAPSIAQAAALATLSPASAAPKPDPASPGTLLTASVQGLHFPNWRRDGGWRPSGARTDEIRGRPVTTVFYSRGYKQLAYSIVARPALVSTGSGPDTYEVFHKGARTYVVWTVSGHSCLLSGVDVSAATLWHLARTTTQS